MAFASSVFGDLSAATRKVAPPKKKPLKKKPPVVAARREPPAKKKQQEVHLGGSLVHGLEHAVRVAATQSRNAPAKKTPAPKSNLAGLSGMAHPGVDLRDLADSITSRATTFGTAKNDRKAFNSQLVGLERKIGNKFGAPTPDFKVPVIHKSGGGLPIAALQGLASLPLAAAGELSKVPGLVADFYQQQQDKQPGIKVPGSKHVAKNLVNDALAIGEAPVVTALSGAGAVLSDATHGRFKATPALAKAIAQAVGQDPVVQLAGAGLGVKGASVKGALASLEEHPGFAGADLLGGLGAFGRGAGAATRGLGKETSSSTFRRNLAKVGDTRRSPIGLTHDAGLAKQSYVHDQGHLSKDLLRAAVQKRSDRKRGTIKDAEGKPVTVDVLGKQMPVLKPKGGGKHNAHELGKDEGLKLQRQRANFLASQAHAVEMGQRLRADKELAAGMREAGIKGKAGKEISSLLTSGTIRHGGTLKEDLLKRADVIKDALAADKRRVDGGEESVYTTRSQRARAVDHEKMLRKAANSDKVIRQAEAVHTQGIAHAGALNKLEGEESRLGLREDARSTRARLSEYALAHIPGVKHITVEQHEKFEATARRAEETARARVDEHPLAGPERTAAIHQYNEARKQRIAVSGRDPVGVDAHERAAYEHTKATARHQAAEKALERAESSRSRLVAVQASHRASGGRTRAATEAEKAKLAKRTQHRDRLVAAEKDARLVRRAARGELEKTPLPETNAAIRHGDGRYLSNKEIEDHARANGRDPDTIAFLPHMEDHLGGRAFHKQFRPGTRPKTGPELRTGALYERGATGFGVERVREQLTHKRTSIAKATLIDKMVNDGGLLHPEYPELKRRAALEERERADGAKPSDPLSAYDRRVVKSEGNFTPAEAADMVKKLADEGHDFVALTRRPAALPAELREKIDKLHDVAAMETAHLQLIQNRLVSEFDRKSQSRNIVLFPAGEYNQLLEHLVPAGHFERAAQLMNAPFRMAVLPQPRWLTGNFIEPFLIRLPLSGAGINLVGAAMDRHAATTWIKSLEKDGAPAALAEADALKSQLGGLFIGRKGASVRRTFEDLKPGSKARKVAYAGHWLRNAPVTRQLSDIILTLPKGFFAINRVLVESEAQKQALGKSIRRDMQAFQGSWMKTARITGDMVKEMRGPGLKTATLERWAKEQHDLLGKYEGFDPTTRRLIQTATPFLPWWMASMRFMYYTLPAEHSVASALLLRSSTVFMDQWKDAHSDAPPGTLKDAIKTAQGGFVDLARYGPAGASIPLIHGDYSDVVDQFFPSLSGLFAAARGKDPFGKDLSSPSGTVTPLQKLLIAANSVAEAMIPLVGVSRRLREGGGSPYSTSTLLFPQTKPGTKYTAGWRKAFYPFNPTYLHGGPSGSSGSSSGSTGGSSSGNPLLGGGGGGGSSAPAAASASGNPLLQ